MISFVVPVHNEEESLATLHQEIDRVVAAESLGDPEAVSHANAVGLMQVLPSTFADYYPDGDPFDPILNLRAGMRYLNTALLEHDGDVADV